MIILRRQADGTGHLTRLDNGVTVIGSLRVMEPLEKGREIRARVAHEPNRGFDATVRGVLENGDVVLTDVREVADPARARIT